MRGDGSARRHRGGSRHRPDPVRSGAVDDRSARPPGPAPRHRNRSRSCSPSPRTRAEGAADRDGVQPGRHRRPGGPPPPTRQSRRGVVTHQSHRPPPQTKRRRTHPRPDPRRRVPGPPGRRGHLPDTHQRRGQADDRPPHPHGPDRTSRRPRRLGAGRLRPRPPDSRRAPRFTLGGIGHRPRHRASDLGGHHPPPPHNHPTPLDRSHQPRLRVPRLQPTSHQMPPRPHRARQPQWQNHHPQPRPALCPPPPTRQTQSRMETRPTPTRHLLPDQSPQPPIRSATPAADRLLVRGPWGARPSSSR